MDEPTRGVDVGAKSEIHRIVSSLAQTGLTIIMISSDMPELLGMCDRLMVLKAGKKTGVLERDEFSQEKVLKLALLRSFLQEKAPWQFLLSSAL